MPILITNPITVPEKVFDKYFAESILINAIPGGEASAQITLTPVNDSNEKYPEGSIGLNVQDIMAKIALAPTGNMAKAMFFLLAAIDEEKTSQDAV
jgi:hypothetical protein